MSFTWILVKYWGGNTQVDELLSEIVQDTLYVQEWFVLILFQLIYLLCSKVSLEEILSYMMIFPESLFV